MICCIVPKKYIIIIFEGLKWRVTWRRSITSPKTEIHRFHHKNIKSDMFAWASLNVMVTKWHVYTWCTQEHFLRVTRILHESCLYILIFPCMLCPRQLLHLLTLGSDCEQIQKVVLTFWTQYQYWAYRQPLAFTALLSSLNTNCKSSKKYNHVGNWGK